MMRNWNWKPSAVAVLLGIATMITGAVYAQINVTNSAADLDGKTLVTEEDNSEITGRYRFERAPDPPFEVEASSAVVTNLDADKLDGQEGSYYTNASNLSSGTIPGARIPDPLPGVSAESLINIPAENIVGTHPNTSIGGTLGVTGLITATGGQVAFPATQSASADANTLDDYEEGTFTPTIDFGGGTTGLTFNGRAGRYVKIGRLVTVWIRIDIDQKGSSSGTANLTGLPFTIENSTEQAGGVAAGNWLVMSSLVDRPGVRLTPNSTAGIFTHGSATAVASLTEANFNNSSAIYLQFSYFSSE